MFSILVILLHLNEQEKDYGYHLLLPSPGNDNGVSVKDRENHVAKSSEGESVRSNDGYSELVC